MAELVSGWSDDRSVYLVFRDGERVSYRKLPARWSCFIRGLDDADRQRLQRIADVIAMKPEPGDLTRIDFRNKWARLELGRKLQGAIKGSLMEKALFAADDDVGGEDAALLEADVQPLRRLLSDVGGLQIGNPRVGYFDLETDSRKTFVEMLQGKARILSWALTDATRTRRASMVLEADTDDAERALIESFFNAAEQFDCLLAWNGYDFDFPVLDQRQQRLRVRHRGNPVIWPRWTWLDQMVCFRKYNQAHESGEERVSFGLDAVAKNLLGQGKTEFNARQTWEAWAAGGTERARLLKYNEDDTDLLPRIEEKTGFVALHIAVCQVTRCFPDTESLGAAQQGDGFMLRLGADRGFRFPTRRGFDEDEGVPVAFAGAYVMEPKRIGALDNVHVCDFAGLYPSIMRSWNMSPDTLISPVEARRTRLPLARLPERDVSFRTDRRGLFPTALDQLVAQRGEYTKRADAAETDSPEWHRYKRLSSAFKIVANSFYGIVGSPFTRFFDRSIAEGVTQTGAWLIKHVARVLERSGLFPFYGDTDSVFAIAGSNDRGASEEDFAKVVASLNESWPATLRDLGCTESRVKLEFEKSFRRLVLVGKKRYAGAYSRYKGKPAPADMKPEIKGLEFKRGDTLRLAREMQSEAIDLLLAPELPSESTMRALVDRWRERLLHGELTIDDIVLAQSVKNLDEYRLRYTSVKCTGRRKGVKGSCGYDWQTTDVPKPEKPARPRRKKGEPEPEPEAPKEPEMPKCPKCGHPRKVAAQPANVRVAHILAARGEIIREGTRIEYVIAGAPEDSNETTLVAIPARDEGAFERIDREYYWDSRVLPPTSRLLASCFPHGSWDESAAKRRKAAAALTKETTKKTNKGKVVDLPLFGAVGEPLVSDRSDKPAPAPRMPQAPASTAIVTAFELGEPVAPASAPAAEPAVAEARRRPTPRVTW